MIGCMLFPGVDVANVEDDHLTLVRNGRQHVLRGTRGLKPTLEKLQNCHLIAIEELAATTGRHTHDLEETASDLFTRTLNMLAARRMIQFCIDSNGRLLCTAAATGQLAYFDFPAKRSLNEDSAEHSYQVSRLVCVRRKGLDLVIDCPRQSVCVTIAAPEVAAVICALARPTLLKALIADIPFMESSQLKDVVRFLIGAGVVGRVDDDGRLPEDRNPILAVREFHDVLMHAHSRSGYTDTAMGGTFRFAGVLPPWPAVSDREYDGFVDLPKPTVANFARKDPPLQEVMEARQSVRVYGESPITLGQLADFLYRVARIRSISRAKFTGDAHAYDVTNRTYPSGGGAYDIEIYPVIYSCAGLQPGVYHYNPMRHGLEFVSRSQELVDQLIAGARVSAHISSGPQVLLVLTSRFGRLSWKYEGIAYATTLRNVGVLYEAMYLVATAIGLAPCALGSGNSAVFAAALGLDSMAESSVGEFMLGSLPAEIDEVGFSARQDECTTSRSTE